jgi:radical SAM superfamily enzyme YgiQ (UPF0313 family)
MVDVRSDIVLATINAGYAHCSLALRSLRAQLGPLREQSALLEFHGQPDAERVARAILERHPRVCGLGVYIWNAALVPEVIARLKLARPDLTVLVGGPEVSYGTAHLRLRTSPDVIVAGEGELVIRMLVERALAGHPLPRHVESPTPQWEQLQDPEPEYTAEDLAHRVIYVESSRGCPYSCEYCLSCLSPGVRYRPEDRVRRAWGELLGRGARRIKVVDRTFNADPSRAARLLKFLAAHLPPDGCVQVEMVPQRFHAELMDAVAGFRPGALRVEVGIQTYNSEVAHVIHRPAFHTVADGFIRALRERGAVVHADLIAGLPGETPESFAAGFDRLVRLEPDELQLNILKRLPGVPIARHEAEWGLRFDPHPPYAVLETRTWSREAMAAVHRMSRYWDLLYNRGRFRRSLSLLWSVAGGSPFHSTAALSEALFQELGRTYAIAPEEIARVILRYLTERLGGSRELVLERLRDDFRAAGVKLPRWLRTL